MAWKIYFWSLTGFTTMGVIIFLLESTTLSLGDWFSLIANIILWFGVYVYIFKKQQYYNLKNLFLANLIISAIFSIDYFLLSGKLSELIHPALKTNYQYSLVELILAVLFTIPALYANFKLATKK